jgi:hypothetical protein
MPCPSVEHAAVPLVRPTQGKVERVIFSAAGREGIPHDPNLALFNVVTRLVAEALHEEELASRAKQRGGGSCISLTSAAGDDDGDDIHMGISRSVHGCREEDDDCKSVQCYPLRVMNEDFPSESTCSAMPAIVPSMAAAAAVAHDLIEEANWGLVTTGSAICRGGSSPICMTAGNSPGWQPAHSLPSEEEVPVVEASQHPGLHMSLNSVQSPITPQLPPSGEAHCAARGLPIWELMETPVAASSAPPQLGALPHRGVRRARR